MSNADLFRTIEDGKIDEVRRLINEGINVNEKDDLGRAPLHVAIEKSNEEAVNALLKARGINVYVKDSLEKTPLDLARDKHHTKLMTALTKTQNEIEALCLAIKDVKVKKIDDLIKEGVNVNVICQDGMTPLHYAAIERNEGVANALIKAGADVNAKDDYGRIPLHWAVNAGSIEVTRILLETKVNVNAQDKNGKAPLHLAAKENHAELVKVLLSNRADISVKDQHGDTPFNLTTNEEIKALLRNAALLKAAKECDIQEVTSLIEAGADVNVKNEYERTPLHLAVKNCNRELVTLLLNSNKVDVNARNKHGSTPLHVAALNNKKDVVEVLLNHGAKSDVVNNYGKTPIDLTADEDIRTILKNAEKPDGDESSTDKEGQGDNVPLHPGIKGNSEEEEHQPDDNKKESIREGTSVEPASKEPTQTEEQPSSFFSSLFSIVTKPFSLIISFFSGFFSWLFGFNERPAAKRYILNSG